MKQVLGWIFNRWTLGLVILLSLLALVWLVGPLVAIGESRPLDSERSRWITTGALLLIVALTVAWRSWAARRGNAAMVERLMAPAVAEKAKGLATESADMMAVRKRFDEALVLLRKARFGAAGTGFWARWKA